MKRKNRKPIKRHRDKNKKRSRLAATKKNSRKNYRVRRKKAIPRNKRAVITDPRVLRALGLMRREGTSASEAAHQEEMKLETFRRRAGRYLYRSGPGKPWKALSQDQLAASMNVITDRGVLAVIVRNSRERKLLHQYNAALRMFRAGEDGAEAALEAFAGCTVGGHALVVDPNLLMQLEEAGELDFENLYASFGDKS
jgi:hypothetical protein